MRVVEYALMHCSVCERQGRSGERQGDTCGDPLRQQFKPFYGTPTSTVGELLEHGRKNMLFDRCLGTLLYPMFVD